MLRLKLISLLGVLLLSCFTVCLPKASAESSSSSLFEKFYMVAASGSTATVTNNEFSTTQVPWLYIKSSDTTINWNSLVSTWIKPSGKTYTIDEYYGDTINISGQEVWITLNSTYLNEEGVWNLTAYYTANDVIIYSGDTSFTLTSSPTVTPEPISAVLFLTGGAALFLRKRRGTVMKHEA